MKIVILRKGDLIIIPPRVSHCYISMGTAALQSVNFGSKFWIPYGLTYKPDNCPHTATIFKVDFFPVVKKHYSENYDAYSKGTRFLITNKVTSRPSKVRFGPFGSFEEIVKELINLRSKGDARRLLTAFFHLASFSCASKNFHEKIMSIGRLDTTTQLQNTDRKLDANILGELARMYTPILIDSWDKVNNTQHFATIVNMVVLSIEELVNIVSMPIPVTTPLKYQLLKFAVWTFVRAFQLEANIPEHHQNCLFDLIRSMAFGTSLMVPTWTRGTVEEVFMWLESRHQVLVAWALYELNNRLRDTTYTLQEDVVSFSRQNPNKLKSFELLHQTNNIPQNEIKFTDFEKYVKLAVAAMKTALKSFNVFPAGFRGLVFTDDNPANPKYKVREPEATTSSSQSIVGTPSIPDRVDIAPGATIGFDGVFVTECIRAFEARAGRPSQSTPPTEFPGSLDDTIIMVDEDGELRAEEPE